MPVRYDQDTKAKAIRQAAVDEGQAPGVSTESAKEIRELRRKVSELEAGETALREITKWLDQDQASQRVVVVTGAPGAGKFAVLAEVARAASAGLPPSRPRTTAHLP